MTVLVIAEHDNRALNGATLNAISAAGRLDMPIHVLVAGGDAQSVAEEQRDPAEADGAGADDGDRPRRCWGRHGWVPRFGVDGPAVTGRRTASG